MENRRSVNSPRRILSFSKNRRATVFFPDPGERASGFGVSGERGPKPSEVYGFVGSITTVVATVVFMVWAYVPEHWLHSVGIYYYPSRLSFIARNLKVGEYIEIWKIDRGTQIYVSRQLTKAVNNLTVLGISNTNLCHGDFSIGNWILHWPQLHGDPSSNFLQHNVCREPASLVPSVHEDEPPIQPMSDIGIDQINDVMFNNLK